MTDNDNNDIQAEPSLSSRNEHGNREPEGTAGTRREDSGTGSDPGELDRSGGSSGILDGDIQDETNAYDPELGQRHHSVEIHQGPLPEAGQLAAYATAGKDFPERIVRMAEQNIQAKIETMARLSKADAFATYAGMFMITGLATLGLVGAFVGGVVYGEPLAFSLAALPVLGYLPKLIDSIKGNSSSD